MAEIHVEKKPRSGWIWLLLLLIVVIAVVAWLFLAGRFEPAPATTAPATTTTDASVASPALLAATTARLAPIAGETSEGRS